MDSPIIAAQPAENHSQWVFLVVVIWGSFAIQLYMFLTKIGSVHEL